MRECVLSRPPLVSVIIPTYNYGHFVKETLKSVADQTYKCIECIIVDDGSTDDTSERVAQVTTNDDRFIYLYKKNEGLGAARNTGITHSRGVYLQLLDSDDLLEPEKIARQVEYLEEHPEVDIVYGSGAISVPRLPKSVFIRCGKGSKLPGFPSCQPVMQTLSRFLSPRPCQSILRSFVDA